MKRIFLISLLLVTTYCVAFEKFPISEKEILNIDPIEAAKAAVKKGDLSLIMVAQCFLGMPGYKGPLPPKQSPRILGQSCEEMENKSTSKNANELHEWARKYNTFIQQHNKQLNMDSGVTAPPPVN